MSDSDRETDESAFHTVYENRVRFAETDPQEVVFYGQYITFQDEAFSSYVEDIGYSYHDIREEGWDLHVVHVDVDYYEPAYYGDVLLNDVRVDAFGESSIEFAHRCRKKESNETVVRSSFTHVAVDEDGDTIRVPDSFRDAVVSYQDVPPDPV